MADYTGLTPEETQMQQVNAILAQRRMAQPQGPLTLLGELGHGLAQGTLGLGTMVGGLGKLAGDITGIEPLSQGGLDLARWFNEKASRYGSDVPFEQAFDSPGKFAHWGIHGIGTAIPTIAASLLGGGAGGFAAKTLATRAAAKEGLEALTKEALEKQITRGVLKGAGLTSYGMESGSIGADQGTQGIVDPLRALTFAAPAAALDILPGTRILSKFPMFEALQKLPLMQTSAGRNFLIRGFKEGLKQGSLEGATEGAQNLLEWAGASRDPFTREGLKQAAAATLIGGMTGGLFGFPGGMLTRPAVQPLPGQEETEGFVSPLAPPSPSPQAAFGIAPQPAAPIPPYFGHEIAREPAYRTLTPQDLTAPQPAAPLPNLFMPPENAVGYPPAPGYESNAVSAAFLDPFMRGITRQKLGGEFNPDMGGFTMGPQGPLTPGPDQFLLGPQGPLVAAARPEPVQRALPFTGRTGMEQIPWYGGFEMVPETVTPEVLPPVGSDVNLLSGQPLLTGREQARISFMPEGGPLPGGLSTEESMNLLNRRQEITDALMEAGNLQGRNLRQAALRDQLGEETNRQRLADLIADTINGRTPYETMPPLTQAEIAAVTQRPERPAAPVSPEDYRTSMELSKIVQAVGMRRGTEGGVRAIKGEVADMSQLIETGIAKNLSPIQIIQQIAEQNFRILQNGPESLGLKLRQYILDRAAGRVPFTLQELAQSKKEMQAEKVAAIAPKPVGNLGKGGEVNAIEIGEKQKGGIGKYRGTNVGIPAKGINRNIPPAQREGSAETGSRNLVGKGPKVGQVQKGQVNPYLPHVVQAVVGKGNKRKDVWAVRGAGRYMSFHKTEAEAQAALEKIAPKQTQTPAKPAMSPKDRINMAKRYKVPSEVMEKGGEQWVLDNIEGFDISKTDPDVAPEAPEHRRMQAHRIAELAHYKLEQKHLGEKEKSFWLGVQRRAWELRERESRKLARPEGEKQILRLAAERGQPGLENRKQYEQATKQAVKERGSSQVTRKLKLSRVIPIENGEIEGRVYNTENNSGQIVDIYDKRSTENRPQIMVRRGGKLVPKERPGGKLFGRIRVMPDGSFTWLHNYANSQESAGTAIAWVNEILRKINRKIIPEKGNRWTMIAEARKTAQSIIKEKSKGKKDKIEEEKILTLSSPNLMSRILTPDQTNILAIELKTTTTAETQREIAKIVNAYTVEGETSFADSKKVAKLEKKLEEAENAVEEAQKNKDKKAAMVAGLAVEDYTEELDKAKIGLLSPAAKKIIRETSATINKRGLRFSISDGSVGVVAANRGANATLIQSYLSPILNKLPLLQGRVAILESIGDAPAFIREMSGAEGKAVYDPDTGMIFVFADRVGNPLHAIRLLLHEGAGHFGLRAVLGKDFDAVLRQVALARPAEIREFLTKYETLFDRAGLARNERILYAAEEILAHRAEYGIKPSLMKRIYAAIRNILRKLGIVGNWTDGDIDALLDQSFRYLENKQGTAAVTAGGLPQLALTPPRLTEQDLKNLNILRPAILSKETGELWIAQPGESHGEVVAKIPVGKISGKFERGFALSDNKTFLDAFDAVDWLKRNDAETYQYLKSKGHFKGMAPNLESYSYGRAKGLTDELGYPVFGAKAARKFPAPFFALTQGRLTKQDMQELNILRPALRDNTDNTLFIAKPGETHYQAWDKVPTERVKHPFERGFALADDKTFLEGSQEAIDWLKKNDPEVARNVDWKRMSRDGKQFLESIEYGMAKGLLNAYGKPRKMPLFSIGSEYAQRQGERLKEFMSSIDADTIKTFAKNAARIDQWGYQGQKFVDEYLPGEVGEIFNDIFGTPYFDSERNPDKFPVVHTADDRRHHSNLINADFRQFGENRFDDLDKEYRKQFSRAERAIFDDLIVRGDQGEYDLSDMIYAEAAKDPRMAGVTPKIFSLYQRVRKGLNEVFGKIKHYMLENAIEVLDEDEDTANRIRQMISDNIDVFKDAPNALIEKLRPLYADVQGMKMIFPEYQNRPWFQELVRMINDRYEYRKGGRYWNLSPEEKAEHKVLKKHGLTNIRNQKEFDQMMFDYQILQDAAQDKELKQAYKTAIENKIVERRVKRAADQLEEPIKSIASMRYELGKLIGFFPRLRKPGRWQVNAYVKLKDKEGNYLLDKNGNIRKRKVYMYLVNTKADARNLIRQLEEKPQEFFDFKKMGGEKKDFIFGDTIQGVPKQAISTGGLFDAVYGDAMGTIATEHLINKSLDNVVNKGALYGNLVDKVRVAIGREAANVILARGGGRTQIHRAPYLIEGYRKEDTMGVIDEYINSMSGYLSKSNYAIKQMRNLNDINDEYKKWAYGYIKADLRNQTMGDRLSASTRNMGALMFMAGKVSTFLINATQNATLGQAELSLHCDNPLAVLTKAAKDTLSKNLTEEEQAAMKYAESTGITMETYVAEFSGGREGVIGKKTKGLSKVVNWLMTPFQIVEQKNREIALLAGYRVFSKKRKFVESPQFKGFNLVAFTDAVDFVNKVHFMMHKGNLPKWARHPVGRSIYALQSYTFNTINWFYNRLTSGDKAQLKAAFRAAAAFVALGGLAALPFADPLNKLYRRLFGKDVMLEWQNWTKDRMGQDSIYDTINAFMWHGIPSLPPFKVNVSNALSVNLPLMSNILEGDSVLMSALGIPGAMLQKVGKSAEMWGKGDKYRSAEYLMPEFITGPMRSYRLKTEGMKTLGGKPMYDEHGKPIFYTTGDVARRSLGFQPLEKSVTMQVKEAERGIQAYWNSQRQDLLDKYRITAAKHPENIPAVKKEHQEFNRKLLQSQAGSLIKPINDKVRRNALKSEPDKRKWKFEEEMME